MTLFKPSALIWALLAVPVVVLYLRRVPPEWHQVQTGFLWERVLSNRQGRAGWLRLRRPVSGVSSC